MPEEHGFDAVILAAHEAIASETMPLKEAVQLIGALRDYAEFDLMQELAEKLLRKVPDQPQITKLYAQALIDTGKPVLARGFLLAALNTLDPDNDEFDDMSGVLGRAHKDILLSNLAAGLTTQAKHDARAALDAYLTAYHKNPGENYYQGINVLALTHVCASEMIPLDGAPPIKALAKELIDELLTRDAPNPWEAATLAEAHNPLEDWEAVATHLGQYIAHPDTTLFMLNGTRRQFHDVWRLQDRDGDPSEIFAMLEAATLAKGAEHGSSAFLDMQNSAEQVKAVGAMEIDQADLEKILGSDGLVTFQWYKTGLKRAESVACVLNPRRKRVGTAFVVDLTDLGLPPPANGKIALMTNFHVLNRGRIRPGLSPNEARIRFDATTSDMIYPVEEVLFESSHADDGLDCTIFTIDARGETFEPIPIYFLDLPLTGVEPSPRVYIIGYPLGGEMQFSLQDNRLLDHEGAPNGMPEVPERLRVHYFAPTEPGNSGSPVFNEAWECIALHHSGGRFDPQTDSGGLDRLNGNAGRYSANEGIWLGSIRSAIS